MNEKFEKDLSEELEKIKKARKDWENVIKEYKDISNKLNVINYGMEKVAKVITQQQDIIENHNEGILELDDRLRAVETNNDKQKKKDDVMYH